MRLILDGPFDNASYTFLIGRAYYELGDMERASPLTSGGGCAEGPDARGRAVLPRRSCATSAAIRAGRRKLFLQRARDRRDARAAGVGAFAG